MIASTSSSFSAAWIKLGTLRCGPFGARLPAEPGFRRRGTCKATRLLSSGMARLESAAVAAALRELGERMELEGGNPYRARAYRRAADNLSLIPELVVEDDLHGILHAHTTESDGSDSLEDMAEAARQRGYDYLGLTDHSQTASAYDRWFCEVWSTSTGTALPLPPRRTEAQAGERGRCARTSPVQRPPSTIRCYCLLGSSAGFTYVIANGPCPWTWITDSWVVQA